MAPKKPDSRRRASRTFPGENGATDILSMPNKWECPWFAACDLAFLDNPAYEELASKFYEHFIHIAGAMDRIGVNNDELWDETDGFYYDVLLLPRGDGMRIKVRFGVSQPAPRPRIVPAPRGSSLHLHAGWPRLPSGL